jgi:hypothetical protein
MRVSRVNDKRGPEFAAAIAEAMCTWMDLTEWQIRAIAAISPVLAERMTDVDRIMDLMEKEDEKDLDELEKDLEKRVDESVKRVFPMRPEVNDG